MNARIGENGFSDICASVSMMACLLILYAQPLNNDDFVSLGTTSLMGMMLVCILLTAVQIGCSKSRTTDNIYFYALLVVCLICIAFNGSIFMLATEYATITAFFMVPCYALLYKYIWNVRRVKTQIYVMNWGLFAILLLHYFSSYSHRYITQHSTQNIEELTLGFDNPNQTAMILFISLIIFLADYFKRNEERKFKMHILLPIIALNIMIFQTKCRVIIILNFLLLVLLVTRKMKWIYIRWVKIIAFIIPFMMLVLVFTLKINILGEAFDSGRSYVFQSVFNSITLRTWLIGSYASYHLSNLHNVYLAVFMAFGGFGLLCFIMFYYSSISYYSKITENSSMERKLAYAGLLCIIIQGSVEAAYFISGTYYACLVGLLFALCQSEEEQIGELYTK